MKVTFLKNTHTIKKVAQLIALLITVLAVAVACGGGATPSGGGLSVSSTAFKDGGTIPNKYAYDFGNVSPPLSWTAGPAGTQSYVLIMEDLDLAKDTTVGTGQDPRHWIVFNIPANVLGLTEDIPKEPQLANGALHGKNRFLEDYYGGPRPKVGTTHRYQFTIYALDKLLDLPAGASPQQVLDAMQGHTLAQGKLIGKYSL